MHFSVFFSEFYTHFFSLDLYGAETKTGCIKGYTFVSNGGVGDVNG